MAEEGIKFSCDLCGDLINIGRPRYIFKGELYCAYDGGKFDESIGDSKTNLQDEIKRLMGVASTKSEKELTDEVHYAYQLDLCRKCRDQAYDMIENGNHSEKE